MVEIAQPGFDVLIQENCFLVITHQVSEDHN